MATNVNDDQLFRPTDEASVALLRGLRTNTIVDCSFVHRADVCSAVPEELVADLAPVPGTEVTEDGYNSVWYVYCPKRYKNARGEPSGHRQRAVEPGRETCWHSEAGPKPVKGVPGGGATFCNLSYGRKEEEDEAAASGRRRVKFVRMGWCLTEFDDTQGGGGDHVLCRVRRSSSSLAKRTFKKSSSSSSKRKAAGDHPEAPPTKLIGHDEQVQEQVHVQVQQDPAAAFFPNAYYPTMPWPCDGYGAPQQGVDPVMTMSGGGQEERGVQQTRVEPAEYGGEFNSFDELLNIEEQVQMQMQNQVQVQPNPAGFFTCNAYAYATTMPACYGPQGVDSAIFGGVEPEHGGGDFNFQDLLKTDEWEGFEDFLAQGEQGLQQPSAETAKQGGGIVVSGGPLYAC